ncbi:LamG-like jellyroll fold domain-containing protein [Chondromyces crocatus]|uniref:LamG-like jellyroll fold domain-containing protein n=1 Tax=Chondromyces crocatus TaxID=52 RepID=A0A0K1EP09_CHOCO|nr:LamG-like jellyroll fold domain-containing protein [Chondromyces crocatus]AKT42392.1 uncharacterized protein CMC5_066180 [Chondromyces crocatus]
MSMPTVLLSAVFSGLVFVTMTSNGEEDSGNSNGPGGSAGTGEAGATGGSGGGGVCRPGEDRSCYSAAPETEGIGICQPGKAFCDVSGQWIADCLGEITPAAEIYSNGIDEDCDGADASATQALVTRALLTRYFLDDEPETPLSSLRDSSPEGTPVNLNVVGGTVTAAEVDGHRGLFWALVNSAGRGVASVGTTKVEDQLLGAKQLTVEVVLSIAGGDVSEGSAITSLGMGGGFGQLDLRFLPPQNLRFYWNNQLAASWEPLVHERCVLHVVVDTDAPMPADRIKLYRNGVQVSASNNGSPTVPALGTTLNLSNDPRYALGNRSSGMRSFQGLLYYSAIYTTNLSAEEIERNASLLLLDDDDLAP